MMKRVFLAAVLASLPLLVVGDLAVAPEPLPTLPEAPFDAVLRSNIALPDYPSDQDLTLLGVSRPTSGAAPTTPCDLVTGCVAAHSVRRRLVATYTGNLFQLSRTGGGGGTQNIGQSGTDVDSAAINTFCGSSNVNSCAYHIVYDQSGNANDVTAVGGDVPFTFDGSWGTAPSPSTTFGTGLHYFNNATPTGLNTGDKDKSVVIVVDDAQFSDGTGTYGQAHNIATPAGTDLCGEVYASPPGDYCGTDFLLGARASKNSLGDSNCRRLELDLEIDVAEQCYATDVATSDSQLSAYQTQSAFGKWVGIASYTASNNAVTLDWNGVYTSTQTYTVGLNCDATTPAHCDNELRLGAGGDGTTNFAVWYEGLIYAKVLTSGNRASLESNAQSYYTIPTTTCTETSGSESVLTTLGESNVTALWGLRRANTHIKGPLGVVQRASDSTFHVIKPVANTCDVDTSDLATFCNATTCTVVVLDNQDMASRFHVTAAPTTTYSSAWLDSWRMDGGTPQPSYTASCIGSRPCLTFGSTAKLSTHGLVAWPPPYTLLAVAANPAATFGTILGSTANFHPYLGGGAAANQALFQADDAGGATATGATAGTWFFYGGETEGSSTGAGQPVSVWLNGTRTASTGTVTNSTVGAQFGASTAFTGTIFEGAVAQGQAVSSGNMSTLYTKLKNYWGIP